MKHIRKRNLIYPCKWLPKILWVIFIHKILARYWKQSNGAEAEAVYGGVNLYDKQGNKIYGL